MEPTYPTQHYLEHAQSPAFSRRPISRLCKKQDVTKNDTFRKYMPDDVRLQQRAKQDVTAVITKQRQTCNAQYIRKTSSDTDHNGIGT